MSSWDNSTIQEKTCFSWVWAIHGVCLSENIQVPTLSGQFVLDQFYYLVETYFFFLGASIRMINFWQHIEKYCASLIIPLGRQKRWQTRQDKWNWSNKIKDGKFFDSTHILARLNCPIWSGSGGIYEYCNQPPGATRDVLVSRLRSWPPFYIVIDLKEQSTLKWKIHIFLFIMWVTQF